MINGKSDFAAASISPTYSRGDILTPEVTEEAIRDQNYIYLNKKENNRVSCHLAIRPTSVCLHISAVNEEDLK